MTPETTQNLTPSGTERLPYRAPRLIVHGSVSQMTKAQPSSPQVGSQLVDARIVFLGPNA